MSDGLGVHSSKMEASASVPYSSSGNAAIPEPRARLAEAMANLPPRSSYSPVVLSGMVRMAEFAAITLTGCVVYAIYLLDKLGFDFYYLAAIPALALLTVAIFQALDIYHVGALRTMILQGFKIIGGWALVFLLAFTAVFFFKLEGVFSRVFFASWFLAGLFVLLTLRLVVSIIVKELTAKGRLDRKTAIVGGGEAGEILIRQLSQQKDSDVRICGVFDDRNDDRSPELVAGFPKLGTVDDLLAYSRHSRIDLVIFTLPVTAEGRLLAMLRKLWVLPIDIRLAAHTQKLRFRPRNYSYIGATPMFDMADKPIADWDIVLKWLFDKIMGTLMLITLSPVMLLVALAVKLDSKGPALFRQKRYGFNNELIEVYKFRSMYTDMTDAAAAKLVTKDDPRVTRVGRFIRKSSLDELPQLFNVVLKGNLSLIGPRPHAIHAKADSRLYDEVVDGYFARHKVKPGITGWAQINGWRGETDTREKIEKRVEHDLHYIENWSVFFDLYILIMTPFALAKTENAY
jgi:Undecaprenyl-phosphate glucose phosphotransferase